MAKRAELALNIPTFINLYGYGYRNVYELSELVSVHDPRLEFEGTRLPRKVGVEECSPFSTRRE
jgi:hypothetical protein